MQKTILFAALALVVLSYAEAKQNEPATAKFEDFKAFHGKQYMSDEHESKSKENFKKNAAAVAAHNKAFQQGKVSYTKELNKFADIDPAVFRQRNGYRPPVNGSISTRTLRTVSKRQNPASFDWRDQNKVSPVKDQGQCGSCWSFSTTGSMEAQQLIKGQTLQTLSEQFLVSCDTNDGGCGGGMYTNAWQYIQSAGGIVSDTTLPYTSGAGDNQGQSQSCPSPAPSDFVANVASYQTVGNDDESMKSALVQYGPLSIALDAQDWQLASDGIYSCSTTNVDHAVLLVGYGTDSGNDYWIVKNSWGTGWGDSGYLKLARGQGDCGVTSNPAYVQLA